MMTKCDVCDEVNWFFQSQILWGGGKLELKTRPGWSFNLVAFNLDYISLFKEIMIIQIWKKRSCHPISLLLPTFNFFRFRVGSIQTSRVRSTSRLIQILFLKDMFSIKFRNKG